MGRYICVCSVGYVCVCLSAQNILPFRRQKLGVNLKVHITARHYRVRPMSALRRGACAYGRQMRRWTDESAAALCTSTSVVMETRSDAGQVINLEGLVGRLSSCAWRHDEKYSQHLQPPRTCSNCTWQKTDRCSWPWVRNLTYLLNLKKDK